MSDLALPTRERILSTAERMFAREGLDRVTLRRLTAEAGVNLAAVNYHFGSKDRLVHEVFSRRLDRLNEERLAALEALLARGRPTLRELLAAFVDPALDLALDPGGGQVFMRVLAHAYAERNEGLRDFLAQRYGHVLKRFVEAIGAVLPRLTRETLYWRLDFIAGALVYAMAEFGVMRRRPGRSAEEHRARASAQLVAFAIGGLAAPPPSPPHPE
ncbi:MAG: TetR/AcrR family transcriptional regulator [Xanthomonadales bacterium]|nr:TetR/AcrR family transcriptional regulator [Xanthomonadales bacterium]